MDKSKLSKIEKLERQKQIIEAQLQKEKSRHKEQQRKDETRRKILLGALFLEKFENEGFNSIKHELDKFLTRNNDRLLFGLPPLDNETA